jgi:hypothetical protein
LGFSRRRPSSDLASRGHLLPRAGEGERGLLALSLSESLRLKGKITLKKTRAVRAAVKTQDTPALPTRDEILAFIARERAVAGERTPAKIGKREIARAFQITGSDKIGLKRVLKELEAEGAVDRRRKSLSKPGACRSRRGLFARSRRRSARQAGRLGRGQGGRPDHRPEFPASPAPGYADSRPG